MIEKKSSNLFFLLLLVSIFKCLRVSVAQDNRFKEVVPASPNAAALGKYGDIPVSYHTGVPQISIPIHTLKEGDLSLPISLNYHSSGIKVEELASWVGLGWSLNAGGVITRTVVGAPDEGNTRAGGYSDVKSSGWYLDGGLHPGFSDPLCEINPNNANSPLEQSCMYKYQDAAKGVADTEPDIYSFNFNGFSGKFFFDHRQPVLQPLQDLKIVPSADFTTWTIVTPDGTIYTFGGSAREDSYFSGGAAGGCCTNEQMSSTSWYLKKIENFNKTRSIDLEYVPESYSYTVRPSHSSVAKSNGSGAQGLQEAPLYVNLVSINGVRLSKISMSSSAEIIEFVAENLREDVSKFKWEGLDNIEAKRLDKIEITASGFSRKFVFNYSHFNSIQTSSYPAFAETLFDLKRLKLDFVQEIAGENSKQPYRFFYETSIPLARRLSLARDHWGYYNGADGNKGLIPTISIVSHEYPNLTNRTPNEDKMKAGILKEVQYPTGGSTKFVFEAHRESATSIVGGLRIKQILIQESSASTPKIKNYTYDYGRLYAGQPQYVESTAYHEYTSASLPDLGFIISSNIRSSLKTTQGYHIGYSVIWVEEPGNGKSTYRYFNSTPGHSYSYPPPPAQYEIGTGELFEEMHEDANGLLVQSSRSYFITDLEKSINAKRVVSLNCVDGCATDNGLMYTNQYVLVKNYTIGTGRRLLAMKSDYKDGATTSTTFYYSPNHNQPIRTEMAKSDGKINETSSYFTKDKYVPSCTINDSECSTVYQATLSTLRSNLRIAIGNCEAAAKSSCSDFRNWNDDDCRTGSGRFSNFDWAWLTRPSSILRNFNKECEPNCVVRQTNECIETSGFLQIYNDGIRQAQQTYLACRQSSIQAYDDCVTTSLNSLSTTDRSLAKMLRGNLNVSFEEVSKVDGIQVAGARTSYDFQNNILLPTEFFYYDNKMQVWPKLADAFYDNIGNIKDYEKENDVAVSYIWGYNKSLPIAQIKNATSSQVFYSGFEEDLSNFSNEARTGRKSHSGEYSIVLPASGSFILSYWKKSGSNAWGYYEQSNVSSNVTIGESNSLIDDVRIYPKGAQMTSYTYDPGIGLTSSTDPNSVSSFYFYDSLGRLTYIKDDKGNILKKYLYNYKDQN